MARVLEQPADEGVHITFGGSRPVRVSRLELHSWLAPDALSLVTARAVLSRPVRRVQAETGAYPAPNSVRTLVLGDSSTVREVVHENSSDLFRHGFWDARDSLFSYAHCAYWFRDDGPHSVIDWSIRLRPWPSSTRRQLLWSRLRTTRSMSGALAGLSRAVEYDHRGDSS